MFMRNIKVAFSLYCSFALMVIFCTSLPNTPVLNAGLTINGLGHLAKHRSFRAGFSYTTNYVDSSNWSGYYVGSGSGNGFQGVKGTWNTQCYSGSVSTSVQESSWVGLGGWFSGEGLVQTGTWLTNNGTYELFWQAIYPDGDIQAQGFEYNLPCRITVNAEVDYHSGICPNDFYTYIQDSKGDVLSSGCINVTGGRQSAEWIDERPDCGKGYHYTSLAQFNYTSWSDVLAEANYNGAPWINPNSFVNTQLLMYDDGPNGKGGSDQYLAYPDGLSVNSNNTFTNRWYHYGNSYGSCTP